MVTLCSHDLPIRRCPECYQKRKETTRFYGDVFRRYQDYVQGALVRSYSFSLTIDQFDALVDQPCFYCGTTKRTRGVDRWDNSVGYELENCRPCCARCNKAKGVLSSREFVDMCCEVADHVRSIETTDEAFS